MKNKLDAIVIRRLSREVITCTIEHIEDDIETYYQLIGCRCIDIVTRYFGGVAFDVVLDDEGLLKANETEEPPTSWWQEQGYTPAYEGLFGVLVLAHHDDEGNLTSVDPMDLIAVNTCAKLINTKDGDLALLFHDVKEA